MHERGGGVRKLVRNVVRVEVSVTRPGLTDRQAQRHKEIVPESFSALEKLKYVNALSLPISGGSTPLLRRAGSKGGA